MSDEESMRERAVQRALNKGYGLVTVAHSLGRKREAVT